MRLHDRLMVETPHPVGADKPFTLYAETFGNAQVIDATDVMTLFFEMEREIMTSAIEGGEEVVKEVWTAERFCNFDWSGLTMNMPPFDNFVIEMHAEHAIQASRQRAGIARPKGDNVDMGHLSVAFCAMERTHWLTTITDNLADYDLDVLEVYQRIKRNDSIKWVLVCSVFSQRPGFPIYGPLVGFSLPVHADGTLSMQSNPEDGPLSLIAPADPLVDQSQVERLVDSSKFLYMSVIPALMAINFMHTPQGERGYHNRVLCKPAKSPNKHYQRKHFRPLTSWHVLDIGPLREQFQRTLGRVPRSSAEFAKAMHIVRGNTATYAPNTYFGKPHPEPITVFRPAHRRGDLDAGRVDKDYRLKGEAS